MQLIHGPHACHTMRGDPYRPHINNVQFTPIVYKPEKFLTFVHFCLSSHPNRHESKPRQSVLLRMISIGPFQISASTKHGIINNNVCDDFLSNSMQQEPSGCISLRGMGPGMLQNIISQFMQQYKQLFMLMKSPINILFKCNGTVAKYLEWC